MSELKSETIYFTHENGEAYAVDMYLKSDADKVIAKKDAEIAELKEHNENYRFDNKNMLRKITKQDAELRHHKYKRCLDKAETCQARYDKADVRVNGHGASWDFTSDEMKFWERWHNRWLELAEKFREAK